MVQRKTFQLYETNCYNGQHSFVVFRVQQKYQELGFGIASVVHKSLVVCLSVFILFFIFYCRVNLTRCSLILLKLFVQMVGREIIVDIDAIQVKNIYL